jgi:hypothetical protein
MVIFRGVAYFPYRLAFPQLAAAYFHLLLADARGVFASCGARWRSFLCHQESSSAAQWGGATYSSSAAQKGGAAYSSALAMVFRWLFRGSSGGLPQLVRRLRVSLRSLRSLLRLLLLLVVISPWVFPRWSDRGRFLGVCSWRRERLCCHGG